MSQDYHLRRIKSRCTVTGFPMDEYGHHLEMAPKRAKESRELTSPYGSLEFAIGSGDDFVCFDYHIIRSALKENYNKPYIILHGTRNSETASYIEDCGYALLQLGPAVLDAVYELMDAQFDDVRHSKAGWNQDHRYFLRAVTRAVAREINVEGWGVPDFSDRQWRKGGKRIDKWVEDFWANFGEWSEWLKGE